MQKATTAWSSLGELSVELFDERILEQLRIESTRNVSIREQERTKMAREIHDELGQVLVALKIDLSLLNRKMVKQNGGRSGQRIHSDLQSMSNLIDTALQAMRRLVTELRIDILERNGLKAAIEWQAQEFQARTKIPVEIRSDLEAIEIEDHLAATALFRIFQEALTNVARHAKASRVETIIQEQKEFFIMQVKDDGVGIRETDLLKDSSYGLKGLKERAFLLQGYVDIYGAPNQGTTVTVRVPLSICKSANRTALATD